MSARSTRSTRSVSLLVTLGAAVLAACDPATAPSGLGTAPASIAASRTSEPAVPTVYATGFAFPRGLAFDDDGALYVAEAGAGGTASTTAAQCPQVVPPVGPYTNGPTSRVSRVDRHGVRTTVVGGLPSDINAMGDVGGAADVAFLDGRLYVLSSGGGCSHGTLTPAAVLRVDRHGATSAVANLSAYLHTHPVARPNAGDFEPDGSWYSMIAVGQWLVAVEPNHGDLVRIDPRSGAVRRIADISASQGHIVPTVVAERHGWLYLSNLGTFPSPVGAERLLRVSPAGAVTVIADGFTQVLGLDFDRAGRLYVLESSVAPFPSPGTGRVTRVDRNGHREVIASGLFLPTALRVGPDGALYISNKGFGPPQSGEVLRLPLRDADGDHEGWDD